MPVRRVLSGLSAVAIVVGLGGTPVPALGASSKHVLQPVDHVKVQVMSASPAAPKPGHTVLPARSADPVQLKKAKDAAEQATNGGRFSMRSAIRTAGSPCTALTQTVSPASPQAPGTAVTFTATATG